MSGLLQKAWSFGPSGIDEAAQAVFSSGRLGEPAPGDPANRAIHPKSDRPVSLFGCADQVKRLLHNFVFRHRSGRNNKIKSVHNPIVADYVFRAPPRSVFSSQGDFLRRSMQSSTLKGEISGPDPRHESIVPIRKSAGASLVDATQIAIRDDILEGVYLPGQKLALSVLSARYGVSLTVLREALNRLATDGLVILEAMVGFRVMRISVEDLDEVANLLKVLMPIAMRAAALHGEPRWEAELMAKLHLFQRAALGSAEAKRAIAHNEFLGAVTSDYGGRRTTELLASLWRSMMLYHRMAMELFSEGAADRVEACRVITHHMIERDVEEAVRLMLDKIETGTTICRAHLSALSASPNLIQAP